MCYAWKGVAGAGGGGGGGGGAAMPKLQCERRVPGKNGADTLPTNLGTGGDANLGAWVLSAGCVNCMAGCLDCPGCCTLANLGAGGTTNLGAVGSGASSACCSDAANWAAVGKGVALSASTALGVVLADALPVPVGT
jgi:hypothetical protein